MPIVFLTESELDEALEIADRFRENGPGIVYYDVDGMIRRLVAEVRAHREFVTEIIRFLELHQAQSILKEALRRRKP